MRLFFFGDLVGRAGRDALIENLPALRQRYAPDFIIVNGENAAAGFGITEKICLDLFNAGVSVITTGNHAWDQKETTGFIGRMPNLLRPINFPAGTPGQGQTIVSNSQGKKLLVVNAMGRLFMDALDDPFAGMERALSPYRLAANVGGILVDFHAEATSEKMAMGHFLDGRVSAVIGTHSHIPTADAQILPKGSAYQSDAGMCGDYDSVIGMEKSVPMQRFTRKLPTERLSPAMGPATICGVMIDIDSVSGLARRIDPIRLGGRLAPALPESENR